MKKRLPGGKRKMMKFIPQVLFAKVSVFKHQKAVCNKEAIREADGQNDNGDFSLSQLID